MSENSQSYQSNQIQTKQTSTSLKNLVGIAITKKMSLNMLKHTIIHKTTRGLNSADANKIKKLIKNIGVIKYINVVFENKTYLPTIGKEKIKEFIFSQNQPLKNSFRQKVANIIGRFGY